MNDHDLVAALREALRPLMHDPPDPGHDIHDQEAEATWLAERERERLETENAALRVIAEALGGEVPTQAELAWWGWKASHEAPWREEEAARLAALLGDRRELVIVRLKPLERRTLEGVTVRWSWACSKSLLGIQPEDWQDPAGWELRARPYLPFPADVLPPPAPDDEEGGWHPIGLRSLTLTNVLVEWVKVAGAALEAGEEVPKLPGAVLVRAWQARGRRVADGRIWVNEYQSKGADPTRVTRSPAILNATLQAVEVDGEPLASVRPPTGLKATRGTATVYQQRPRPGGEQGSLWPLPKSLSGHRVDDLLLLTLSQHSLVGDERSSLRGDVLRLGRLAYALSQGVAFDEAAGAEIVSGGTTAGGIGRWWAATAILDGLQYTINPRTGEWLPIATAEPQGDGSVLLAPPDWWKGGRGEAAGWRMSGGLFRPALLRGASRGTGIGHWDDLHRTIDGLEAALSWGPSAGKGRGGRIPDNLRPERQGGPGPEVFVPWYLVLKLAGEPVATGTQMRSTEGRRYQTRLERLEQAGYFVPSGGAAAPAGDTVEIVEAVDGNEARTRRLDGAGIYVRATARFCAAIAAGQRSRNWSLIPLLRLLPYSPDPRKVP